jgi:hypothetical protein
MAGGRIEPEAYKFLRAYLDQLSSSGSNTISELLLDFDWEKYRPSDWDQEPLIRSFWEHLWTVLFPRLTVIGCRSEALDAVTSSLLSISKFTPVQRHLGIFLLENDILGIPRTTKGRNYNFDTLREVYRAGHLEKIYIPASNTPPNSVKSLVRYCIARRIPIYDTEGWQVYEALPP